MDDNQIRKDIEAMVNYLKIHQPENATPEYAAAMLDTIQSTLHNIALNDPEELLTIFEEIKKNKEVK